MRQRVNVAPFHRRILPWIFIVVFLAMAPALVFYTAGYRWNPKKGKIELYGTVIIDSVPTGARVSIDGRDTGFTTPVTIQDMAPGDHQFSVAKDGYHEWHKSLEVRSEHVTFANAVTLWKDDAPIGFANGTTTAISTSPDQRFLVGLSQATTTRATMYDLSLGTSSPVEFPTLLRPPLRISWAQDSRNFLVESGTGSAASDWLVDAPKKHEPLKLPPAAYRWMPGELVGNAGKALLTIHLSDSSVNRAVLTSPTVDRSDTAELRTATSTSQLVSVALARPERGIVLPPGSWTYWSDTASIILLRDGANWLSLQDRKDRPETHAATGDMLRPNATGRRTRELLLNGGEIWIWNPTADPELAYRQSDPLVNAAWHAAGLDIFFATDKQVSALNLDPRDGRLITPLASFDRIFDLAATDKTLYIAGTKNDRTGIWSLGVQ